MMRALAAAAALLFAGCAHSPREPSDPVARAATWLQGRFDNAAQVRADPRFLAVTVRWTPIWTPRTDGRWFLVEQALAETPESPYRRRIHRLRADGSGGVLSEVFLVPAGVESWPLGGFSPDRLLPQPGCTVYLIPAGRGLRGATRGRNCVSRFRGAAWTTAEVVVDGAGFASWDRGFAADGTQVWGARAGPYVFQRSNSR
jgi:hypothetical protein